MNGKLWCTGLSTYLRNFSDAHHHLMGRFDSEENRGISIPDRVLDQIFTKEEKGDYKKDERFAPKKRTKGKTISRKEKRKEERQLKKQKRSKGNHSSLALPTLRANSKLQDQDDPLAKLAALKKQKKEADPLAQLAALKAKLAGSNEGINASSKKSGEKSNGSSKYSHEETSGLKVIKESDLDDEDFGEFDDELEADFNGFEEENAEESLDEEEDPMEALRALKAKKNSNKSEVRVVKESDLEDELDSDDVDGFSEDFETHNEEEDYLSAGSNGSEPEDSDDFDSELGDDNLDLEENPLEKLKALKEAKNKKDKKDKKKEKVVEATFVDPLENDMEFYAKKLGLKKGKSSKLEKTSEDDVIGGLLDGLDFDFQEANSEEVLSEDESNEYNSSEDEEPRQKENPFVAPTTENEVLEEQSESQPTKYIPPALRRKLAMENSGMSEEVLALQKSIKGPINKLSESNVGSIVNEINGLFLNNPRQLVNENLTSIILDGIIQQGRLLDTFVYLHATLVVALYRLQGVDFGAYFIQTLIEKFESLRSDQSKGKETLNLSSLLSAVYAFQLVSSKLLYDVIRSLIEELSEPNAEILLKIVRNSGNQMRSDDPSALKEIVLQISKKSASLPKESVSMRMQFLVETITSLKNNKMKAQNEDTHQLTIRLKKFLGTFTSNKFADPIQVSLQDIREVNTKGKWWLVGSAWKGNDSNNEQNSLVNSDVMNDILDNAEPNWLELARAQRMNTDIRRAIFISIMSANDFMDAVTKLDKLALKKVQEREIPRILIHCAVVEPSWNPYYGILASKLCDSHSLRKTFQFMLWDLVKSFEGANGDDSDDEDMFYGFDDDQEDDDKLKKILNLGRLFGHMFAEGSLALHALRTVNFVAASPDNKLFMEVVLVTFLDQIAKKSQVNSVGVGLMGSKKSMSEQKFDDRVLIERLLKAKEQPALLQGIQHFIGKRLRNSDFITGKKQRKRIEWGVNAMSDIIDEFVKENSF